MPERNGPGAPADAPEADGDCPNRTPGRYEAVDPAVRRLVGGDRLPARRAHLVDSEL